MQCPVDKTELEKAILGSVEIDVCPKCSGIWFDEDELRQAKDAKDPKLNWMDIDLWQDAKKFQISRGCQVCCPSCRMPLYEVQYDKSKVRIDVCNLCGGVWLDKGEFKKIIAYLRERADYEVLYNFSRNLAKQLGEVFVGPESMRSEILDFITLSKLLAYKIRAKHPFLLDTLNIVLPK